MSQQPVTCVTEAVNIITRAAVAEIDDAADRADRLPAGELGDWCEACADAGDPNPVRQPRLVFPGGRAIYICHRCATSWNCWWAIEAVS